MSNARKIFTIILSVIVLICSFLPIFSYCISDEELEKVNLIQDKLGVARTTDNVFNFTFISLIGNESGETFYRFLDSDDLNKTKDELTEKEKIDLISFLENERRIGKYFFNEKVSNLLNEGDDLLARGIVYIVLYILSLICIGVLMVGHLGMSVWSIISLIKKNNEDLPVGLPLTMSMLLLPTFGFFGLAITPTVIVMLFCVFLRLLVDFIIVWRKPSSSDESKKYKHGYMLQAVGGFACHTLLIFGFLLSNAPEKIIESVLMTDSLAAKIILPSITAVVIAMFYLLTIVPYALVTTPRLICEETDIKHKNGRQWTILAIIVVLVLVALLLISNGVASNKIFESFDAWKNPVSQEAANLNALKEMKGASFGTVIDIFMHICYAQTAEMFGLIILILGAIGYVVLEFTRVPLFSKLCSGLSSKDKEKALAASLHNTKEVKNKDEEKPAPAQKETINVQQAPSTNREEVVTSKFARDEIVEGVTIIPASDIFKVFDNEKGYKLMLEWPNGNKRECKQIGARVIKTSDNNEVYVMIAVPVDATAEETEPYAFIIGSIDSKITASICTEEERKEALNGFNPLKDNVTISSLTKKKKK